MGSAGRRDPKEVASCLGHFLCPGSGPDPAGRALARPGPVPWGTRLRGLHPAACSGLPRSPASICRPLPSAWECLFFFQNPRLPPRQPSKGWCSGDISAPRDGGACRQPLAPARGGMQRLRDSALGRAWKPLCLPWPGFARPFPRGGGCWPHPLSLPLGAARQDLGQSRGRRWLQAAAVASPWWPSLGRGAGPS